MYFFSSLSFVHVCLVSSVVYFFRWLFVYFVRPVFIYFVGLCLFSSLVLYVCMYFVRS